MFIANRRAFAATVALAAFTLVAAGAPAFAANSQVDPQEAKCANTLGKGAGKIAKTVTSNLAKCRDSLAPGMCPDAAAQGKIDGAQAKLIPSVVKTCASVCSISQDVACIADNRCPPLAAANELCSAGAKAILFDIADLGFPGPFCEGVLGGPIGLGDDLGECVGTLAEQPATDVIDAVYGGLDASTLTGTVDKCLGSISKSAQKFSSAIIKGVVKCRGAIYSGKVIGNPATCRTDDPKVAAKIAKAQTALTDTIQNSCSDADILALDLCDNGVGGTANRAAAQVCLVDAIEEATDTTTNPSLRLYSPRSLVEAAYPPPRGICGDGVANQIPNPFQLLGEECDGDDDSACPGDCLPAGDVYECTCADRALIRFFADGLTADLDSGWTGTSHDSGVADNAGYINEAINCNCSALTGATCTGTTSDAVCDLVGFQLPSCSWDPLSTTRCDAHGNSNGVDANSDCNRCDQFNVNAGAFCTNESQCSGQCFDTNNTPVGPCDSQADCNTNFPGTSCRGQCDDSATCIIIPNGAPLPISSGGTPVCILTTFRENIFGTRNIVTGEHAVFIQQFSKVHLGVGETVPCPLCGGFCNGTASYPLRGSVCEGTCSVTTSTSCRFDSDCPISETCTTTSPQCPGSTCNLSLVCGGGGGATPEALQPNYGKVCRLEAQTTDFGTTSSDCPPNAGQNISGQGLEIDFYPSTSEAVVLPSTLPCETPGFELFLCPCDDDNGLKTQPNECAGACNAGAERGQGCATGAGNINGRFTTCLGGINVNDACDQDSDCPLSTCSKNPTHCTGGLPADELKLCVTNGDCGGGTCGDACPSGRCVPFCVQSDDVDAPPNTKNNPEEGVCSAGPAFYHCTGVNFTFKTCTASNANGGCSATCHNTCNEGGVGTGGSGLPCDPTVSCPGAEICCGPCGKASPCQGGSDGILGNSDDVPAGGICAPDIKDCVVNDFAAEGGDTLNGNGDATNVRSVSTYCIGATGNATVNNTAGLGGPGRLRQQGQNVVNKNTIP